MSEASITILGSGSGMPNPDRNGSGYLLQVGESLSLFDCGSGVAASFLRNGFDITRLDRIFISHTHVDHVSDLAVFIQMLQAQGVGRWLDVYMPEDFVRPFQVYLAGLYMIEERLRFDLRLHGYGEGFVYDEGFRLEVVPNSHQSVLIPEFRQYGYPNRMECFSFLISVEGKRVLYSGDVGSFEDVRRLLDNLDLAIVEITHYDVDQLLAYIPDSSVRKYILTHLSEREAVRQLDRTIARLGIEKVSLAEDGLWLEL